MKTKYALLVCLFLAGICFAQDFGVLLNRIKTYEFGDKRDDLISLQTYVIDSSTDDKLRHNVAQQLASLLESDATYAAKQFICRQLALVGTKDQVPILTKYLLDDDLSDMARYALVHISHPSVDKALRRALANADNVQKSGIIQSLANRKDRNAVPSLAGLSSSSDTLVANMAIKALGEIGGDQAIAIIQECLFSQSNKNQAELADAYLRCADQILTTNKPRAAEMYQEVFETLGIPHIRAAALQGMQMANHPQASRYILDALKDDQLDLARVAASLVADIPAEKDIYPIDDFNDLNADVRIALLYSCAQRGDRSVIPMVETACSDKDRRVRLAALNALAELGDESHVLFLAQHATKSQTGEQQAARDALVALSGKDVEKFMIKSLEKSNDENTLFVLLDVLAKRNTTRATGPILALAKTSDGKLWQASFKALAEVAVDDELSDMITLMLSGQTESKAAEEAVLQVMRKSDNPDPFIRDMIREYQKQSKTNIKLSLIRVIGRTGRENSLPFLRREMEKQDEEVKEEIIRTLAEWPSASPLKDLYKIAKKAKNQKQGILALRGVIELVSRNEELNPGEKLDWYKKAFELAAQNTEKKQILSKLAEIKSFPAMYFAARFLKSPGIASEAVTAVLGNASAVYKANTRMTRLVVQHVLENIHTEPLNTQADALLEDISSYESGEMDKWFDQIPPVSLFDGSSFDGWEGNLEFFRIQDSAIVAGRLDRPIPNNEFLCTTDRYGDFELTLLFKLVKTTDKGNAGIQIRSERIPNHHEMIGYQADIGQNYWGSLYDESRRRETLASPDEDLFNLAVKHNDWNTYKIRCVDNRIQLWLNGYQTVDYVETADSVKQMGLIGLQIHSGPPAEAWYKDIQIKEYQSVNFTPQAINAESDFEAATVVDINRDGNPDIFCGGYWYEGPDWVKHFVRDVPKEGSYYLDFAAVPQDVDKDGWIDIINGSWHGKDVFWLRNIKNFEHSFEKIPIDKPGNLETLIPVDINGDDQLDILPNTVKSAQWYEYKTDPSEEYGVKWIKHVLPKQAAGHGLGAGDINGDGQTDIVAPGGWLEQTDWQTDAWVWHADFDLGHASIPILVDDIDRDGDGDILWGMGHGYGIHWLEQTGDHTWTRHDIDSTWSQPHYLILADLDLDGCKELVTGKRYHAHNGHDPGGEHPLCVYYYSFDESDRTWTRHPVHVGGAIGFGIYTTIADIDKDGDPDIIAPGKTGLFLLKNELR